METFWQDLRYGARALLKNPGFAIVQVLALSLALTRMKSEGRREESGVRLKKARH